MNKEEQMLNYLPEFLANLREFNQSIKTEAPEFEKSLSEINDLLDQNFVMTATWGLDRWERIAYVSREPDSTIEQRRRRIINHLSSNQPATHILLESLINNYLTDNSVDLKFNKDNPYRLDIHFNWQDFNWQRLLEEFKLAVPAHLDFTFFPTDSNVIDFGYQSNIRFREYHRVREMYVGMSLTKSVREVSL